MIDNLLEHLAPGPHELVLFDVNRRSRQSTSCLPIPGPLTRRLMADGTLPFHLTLITNETADAAPWSAAARRRSRRGDDRDARTRLAARA